MKEKKTYMDTNIITTIKHLDIKDI